MPASSSKRAPLDGQQHRIQHQRQSMSSSASATAAAMAPLPSMPILIGVGADIAQRRLDLLAHEFGGVIGSTAWTPLGVLHRHGGDRRLGIDAEGLRGLEIGLDARAAAEESEPAMTSKRGSRAHSSGDLFDRAGDLRAPRRARVFSSSPSAITRIRGSVPDLRTSTRP